MGMKVILAAALSADGFISPTPDLRSYEWTSKEDRKHLIALSKEAGVIVMGANTYRTFRVSQAPPGRRLLVYTTNPLSITGTNIETTDKAPAALIAQLESQGATGLIVEGGSSIYHMFLAAGVVDELYLTIEPVLFGEGVRLLSNALTQQLELIDTNMLNAHSIVLHYAVKK